MNYLSNQRKMFSITFGRRQHFEISVKKEADGKFYWKTKTGSSQISVGKEANGKIYWETKTGSTPIGL